MALIKADQKKRSSLMSLMRRQTNYVGASTMQHRWPVRYVSSMLCWLKRQENPGGLHVSGTSTQVTLLLDVQ